MNTGADMRIPVPEAIQRIAASEDRILAWHFFVFFSRFEYALKRCDEYLTVSAQPNWDKFASDHANQFDNLESIALKAAVTYIKENPPRKQLQQAGKLSWSEPQVYDTREPLLLWLLRMVRCIRNNLFHGGKFPLIPISDPSRDRELLLNSMYILESCLSLNRKVECQFYKRIGE